VTDLILFQRIHMNALGHTQWHYRIEKHSLPNAVL